MADIRQPFPQPPSTGRELAARPNFTIPGEAPYPRSGPPQAAPERMQPPKPRFVPGNSPEAQQFRSTTAAPTGAAPKPAMPSTGGMKRTADLLGSKEDWAKFGNGLRGGADSPHKTFRLTNPPDASKFGKLLKVGGVATGLVGGYNAYQGFKEGDTLKGAVGTADAAAGAALFTPAAPAAATYLAGRGAYEGGKYAGQLVNDHLLSDDTKDIIGGTMNQIANWFGGGTDDSAYLEQKARERTAQPPTASATPTAAATSAPAPIPTANPNIGPHPDLTQALASVPQNMPAGLRDGAVYKTKDANGRTVYSGTNVKQGADMIDGQGKPVGSLRDTYGPSSVQPAAQEQYFVQPTAAQPGAPAPAQQPAAQGQAPVTTVNKATDAAGNVTYSGNSTRPAAAAQPAAAAAQPAAAAAQPAAAVAQPAAAQPAGPSLDFDTSRGAVSTLPAGISPFASADGVGGSALSAARQAAADRGDWDAVSRSYGEAPQGGQGGSSLRMGGGYSAGPSVAPHVAQFEKFAQQAARSNAESAAMAATKSGSVRERGRGMATLAQLAGGDQDAATSRYNNDNNAATSRYGSDNSLRGSVYSADSQNASSRYTADMGLRGAYAKSMPAQAQRQAQAMAMQMAGGDIPTALKIMAQHGYSGEGLIATQGALNSDQTTQQNLSEGARKNAAVRFGQFMQTGEDGKPVAGAEGALLNSMESIIPGSTQMREDQLAAPVDLGRGVVMSGQAAVTAGLTVLKGLNTTNDNAFLQSIGWDPKNPRLDQLPDLNGAKLDRVGLIKGGLKGGDVSSGNYQLDLGGGRVLYLPHDQIGENELALLRARGVNIPK